MKTHWTMANGSDGLKSLALAVMFLPCGVLAGEPPEWWRGPASDGEWLRPNGFDSTCVRLPCALPGSRVLALGDHSALVAAPWGVVRIDRDHGILENLELPEGWDQVRLGTDDQILVSAGGVLMVDGVPRWRDVVAWDATPGQLAVATPKRLHLDPGETMRIPHVRQVLVTAEGRVVADDGLLLHIRMTDGWREETRPDGALSRVGAQVRLQTSEGTRVLTIPGRTWASSSDPVPDTTPWTRQTEVSDAPCGIDTTASFPTDREPAAPPDPVPTKPGLPLTLTGKKGQTQGGEVVHDMLDEGPPAMVEIRIALPSDVAFPEELWFACDGRKSGESEPQWVQPSHLLWADRLAGRVTMVEPPPDCRPHRVTSAGGLGVLWCGGGGAWLYDGDAWLREPGMDASTEGPLFWHPDGTLSMGLTDTVLVRAPAKPGEGRWRAVEIEEWNWLLGPNGTLRFVELDGTTIRVRDETGVMLAERVGLAPGRYVVESLGAGIGIQREWAGEWKDLGWLVEDGSPR